MLGGRSNNQWGPELEALKKEIDALKNGKIVSDGRGIMETTMVLGGLREYSSVEDAWCWISNELWTAYGPQPVTVGSRGEFKGIAYVQFETKHERDAALQVFELLKKREDGSSNVWAKADKD